jgi:hypothetical protein
MEQEEIEKLDQIAVKTISRIIIHDRNLIKWRKWNNFYKIVLQYSLFSYVYVDTVIRSVWYPTVTVMIQFQYT